MPDPGSQGNPLRPLLVVAIAAFLGWTAVAGGVFGWYAAQVRQAAYEAAILEVRGLLERESVLRGWPTDHGGAGQGVTMAEVASRYGVMLRTPSHTPLALANRPDDWETMALGRLAAGESEVRGQDRIDGLPVLRLMRPILAEASCLGCHAAFRAGTMAGGMVVSVPLPQRRDAVSRKLERDGLAALALWLTVALAIGGSAVLMGRRSLHGYREMLALREEAEQVRRQAAAIPAGTGREGERLRQSEVRLAEAQRIARLGNWTWNREFGEFLCSEEVHRIFGHPAGEGPADREGFLAALVPEDQAELLRAEEAALGGGAPISLDLRILLPSGDRRWVHLEGIADLEGGRLDGTVQDITERKEREEAMQRAAQELARANIQLERFAYVAAHDLQEPLRNIVSYSQLLGKRYTEALSGDGRDYLAMVIGAATRMRILVGDLMTYSRLDSRAQPFKRLDTGEAVGAAEASLHEAISETGAQIVLGPMPAINGDEMQMALVFQHLIGNAIKFHREGVAPRVEIGARLEGKDWLFWVRDNGIGIESQYLEQIFEVFKRLHPPAEYPGTGIGLAIGRRVIERHGGRIWAESVPGQGSTFFFTIPVRA